MPKIYRPQSSFMFPNGDIIDPSENNTFTAKVNGETCIAYRTTIYDMSNELIVGSSTRTNLPQTKYNGETIEYTLSADNLTAGNEYKWSIAMYGNDVSGSINAGVVTSTNHNFETGDVVYVHTTNSTFSDFTQYYIGKITKDTFALYAYLEGARNDSGRLGADISSDTSITVSSIGISEQCIFKAYSQPEFTLTAEELTGYTAKFTPIYTQAEGLTVNSFTVDYYSDFNSTPISSGKIYSSKLEYAIDGLLSGHTYYVKFTATNSIGQETTTGYVAFEVSYSTTSLGVQPAIYNNSENSCIDIEWDNITQISGIATQGTYKFIDNYRAVGNTALELNPNATLEYKDIQCKDGGSLPMFNWEPKSKDWSGTIFRMDNSETGEYVKLDYDDGVFTLTQDDVSKIIYEEQVVEGMSFYIGMVDDVLYMYPNDMSYLQQFTMVGYNTPIRLAEMEES